MFGKYPGVPGFGASVDTLPPVGRDEAAAMIVPGLFGRGRRRSDTLNQARPRPSEIEAAAAQGMSAAGPDATGSVALALPGPISGFGGGTWNVDGSPATQDRNGGMRALPGSSASNAPAMEAQEAAPGHWTVEGFEKLRSALPAVQPQGGGPLGGSMREPFDYQAALARLSGEKPKIKDWQKVVALVADTLAGAGGREGNTYSSLMARQNDYEERSRKAEETVLGWQYKDHERRHEADLRAANPFTIGRDRVLYDPASGQANVIYDGAEDFELYAQELGLEPGSPEYFQAVEDFVLRSSGPSAHERDIQLDDHRTGNDRSLESLRYGNRMGLEDLRQRNRRGVIDYRNDNPPPRSRGSGAPRESIVSVKTPAEAARLPKGTKFRTPDGRVKVAR
jgi:hypothetical protein